jgi:hypothetical protein
MAGRGGAGLGLARRGAAGRGKAWRGKARINMIYFIRMAGSNYVKIGYTGNGIDSRMADLQTACPRRLELIHQVEGDEIAERAYHRCYFQYLTDGGSEWFDLPTEIIKDITERKTHAHNSNGIEGITPFDVRPISGRQQYETPPGGENVSERGSAFDDPEHQYLFAAMRRKH